MNGNQCHIKCLPRINTFKLVLIRVFVTYRSHSVNIASSMLNLYGNVSKKQI